MQFDAEGLISLSDTSNLNIIPVVCALYEKHTLYIYAKLFFKYDKVWNLNEITAPSDVLNYYL